MKALLTVALLLFAITAQAQLNVWALDDGERVQQTDTTLQITDQYGNTVNVNVDHDWYATDTLNLVWRNGKINLFGVRNEIVAFQAIVEAGTSTQNGISVGMSTLTLQGGSATISNAGWNGDVFNYINRHIEVFIAGYTNIVARQPWFMTFNPNPAAVPMPHSYYLGMMPDGLMPHEYQTTFSIAANHNQTVWVDIYIPRTQVEGVYNGTFTVYQYGEAKVVVPVQLTVYDATLPDTTPFHLWSQSYEGHIANHMQVGFPPTSYADSVTFLNRLKKWAQMFHRHRQIISFGSRFSYKELSDIEKFGGFYTGAAYSAAKGYDGPGQNVGDGLSCIGTYNHLLAASTALSGSLAPPNTPIQSTFVWGASTQANVEMESDRWETWFVNNAPNTYRVFYVQDEPFTPDWDLDGTVSDAHDTAAVFYVIRKFAGWIRNNPGPGGNLNTMAPDKMWDCLYGTGISPARLDEPVGNLITAQNSSGGMVYLHGQLSGLHIRSDSMGIWVDEMSAEPAVGVTSGSNPSGAGVFNANFAWGQIRGRGTVSVDIGGGTWHDYPYKWFVSGSPDVFTLYGTLSQTYGTGLNMTAPWAEEWGRWYNVDYYRAQGDAIFQYGGGWPAWGEAYCYDWPLAAGRVMPLISCRYPNTWDGLFTYETLEGYASGYDMWNYKLDYQNLRMGEPNATLAYIGDSKKGGFRDLGVPGPIASIRMKAMRRGQQDLSYYYLARSLGLADTMALRTPVPYALDDFNATWPNGWNQVPYSLRSGMYERMRRTLAQAIDGGETTPPPNAVLTSNDYDLTTAGPVTLTWSSTGATGGVISPQASGDIGDSAVGTSGSGSFYVAQSQVYTYKAFNTLGDTGYAYASIVVGATAPELIVNGDMEADGGWWSYDNSTPAGTYGRVTGEKHAGSYSWESDLPSAYNAGSPNVQTTLLDNYFALTSDRTYTLSFWIKANTATSVRVRVLKHGTPYTNYGLDTVVNITTGWAQITKSFVAANFTGTVSDAYLQFMHTYLTTVWSVANATIWFDDISLKEQSPTSLGAPTLLYPSLYATQVDTPTIFTWTAVSGAESYHLQVDNNNDFLSLTHVDSGLTVLADTTGVGVLASGVTYYWRVRAKNALGIGPWGGGASQYFSTVSGTPATAPTVTFPVYGQYHVSLSPVFYWQAVVGATYYLWEMTTDTVNGVRDTAYVANPYQGVGSSERHPALQPSSTYYWRVRSGNPLGAGPASIWNPFYTGTRVGLSNKKILRTR